LKNKQRLDILNIT